MTFGRFTLDLWNPIAEKLWCVGIHTCSSTLMFEGPGLSFSVYYGPVRR